MQKTSFLLKRPVYGIVWDSVNEVWQHLAPRLSEHRFEFDLVSDYESLTAALEARTVDILILSDKLSSVDLVKYLRMNLVAKDLPLLILSTSRDNTHKEKLFEAGISDFLHKPFSLSELLARIRNLVAAYRLQSLLEESNVSLETQVQQRTQELFEANHALTLANSQLAVVDELKNRFLGLISHELRTPLNGIFGAIELMQSMGEATDETFQTIYSVSRKRIELLIADSQLLARLDTAHVSGKGRRVDLTPMLEVAIAQFEPEQVTSHELPEIPVFTQVSEHTLRILLIKFLDLGVKFRVVGPVKVILKVNVNQGLLRLNVAEATIPEGLRARFFEPFEVGEHETSGRDLGLQPALAGALAGLLGGSIRITQNEADGLSFVMEFPLAS